MSDARGSDEGSASVRSCAERRSGRLRSRSLARIGLQREVRRADGPLRNRVSWSARITLSPTETELSSSVRRRVAVRRTPSAGASSRTAVTIPWRCGARSPLRRPTKSPRVALERGVLSVVDPCRARPASTASRTPARRTSISVPPERRAHPGRRSSPSATRRHWTARHPRRRPRDVALRPGVVRDRVVADGDENDRSRPRGRAHDPPTVSTDVRYRPVEQIDAAGCPALTGGETPPECPLGRCGFSIERLVSAVRSSATLDRPTKPSPSAPTGILYRNM